jgi:hypothetical protein
MQGEHFTKIDTKIELDDNKFALIGTWSGSFPSFSFPLPMKILISS